MTLTAMRPDSGRSNGREVSLWSDAHASASISAFKVVLNARSLADAPAPLALQMPDERAALHATTTFSSR